MKAAVLRRTGLDLCVEDVVIAPPQPGEILVRIAATGICQSDVSVIRGKVPIELPLIPGHEAAGTVEQIGGGGGGRIAAGDRVALSWAPNCAHCFYCKRDHPTLCSVYNTAAATGTLWNGTSRLGSAGSIRHYSCISSFAEYAVVPEAACVRLPDAVPFTVGALVGCAVTTGFGAVVYDAGAQPGDSIAVFGIGGVGINALEAARLSRAGTIVAVDIDPDKQVAATAAGANIFIDARDSDAVDRIRAATNGRGVDHAIECTGQASAMQLAYAVTRPAGTLVVVGITASGTDITIPASGFPGSKKRIIGSIYGGGQPATDFGRIFALYEDGLLDLDRQIGAILPLTAINDAVRITEKGAAGRIMIRP
ncbi:hypothetical protein ASG67_12050 [Sphingomonas sp. Leaf339]|nr:hypothetical protein ASG67_12050 [Sphingomonas sp. Leaf339]